MAVRPKARVCGSLLAGTAGSNPAGNTYLLVVSVMCYQVEVSVPGCIFPFHTYIRQWEAELCIKTNS